VHALVERQRKLVELLKAQAEADLSLYCRQVALGGVDQGAFARVIVSIFAKSMAAAPDDVRSELDVVKRGIARVSMKATILRSDHELAFLDAVAALYKDSMPDLRSAIADPGGKDVSQQQKPPRRPR